jgi:hypothetical protein
MGRGGCSVEYLCISLCVYHLFSVQCVCMCVIRARNVFAMKLLVFHQLRRANMHNS